MPIKSGMITPREQRFAERFASTGDAAYAAEKAGYAIPASGASQNLRKPAVLAEIRRQQQERLTSEILPLAVGRLKQTLEDESVTGQPLNRAIELGIKYGLALAPETLGKDPSEWTVEELEQAREMLLDRLAGAARDVTTPKAAENGIFD